MNFRTSLLCALLPVTLLTCTFLAAPQSALGMIIMGILTILMWFSPLIAAAAVGWCVYRYTSVQRPQNFGLSCILASSAAMFIFMLHVSTPTQFLVMLTSIGLAIHAEMQRRDAKQIIWSTGFIVGAMIAGGLLNQNAINQVMWESDRDLFNSAYQVGAKADLRAQADGRLREMVAEVSGREAAVFRTWLLDAAPVQNGDSRMSNFLAPPDTAFKSSGGFTCYGDAPTGGREDYPLDHVLKKRVCVMRAETHKPADQLKKILELNALLRSRGDG